MVSPHHGRGAFDGRVAGMEAVVALEHGLLKAEASGLFAPGELLVTAVSTKDMLTCYAGGGCENVLGAPAESFIHTSLLDGLHAEDVRNLVFAFHLFPTILPEVINRVGAPRSTARKPRKDGVRRSGAEGGADDDVQSAETPAAGSEPWAKEREKMRARAAHDAEGVLPLPDAAQLLPHGYLRRRLADGRFVAMERLGGMIVSNDTAASVLEEARKPSVEELSTLFGGGNRSPENNSPPEQRTHSLSSLERAPSAAERAAALGHRDAGAAALGAQRPTSLDETKAVTGAFDGMALADEKAKGKAAVVEFGRRAPATERPYPGSAAEDERLAPAAPPPPSSAAAAASSVVLNKYHPSAKRDAKPDSIALGRSAVSAPSAGRSQAGDPAALSPAASSFVYPSAGGAKALSGPAPPSSAPPTSTVEAAVKARRAAEEADGARAASRDADVSAESAKEAPAESAKEAPAESAKEAPAESAKEAPEEAPEAKAGKNENENETATYAAPTGATVVLNKYPPSKKREWSGGAARSTAVPAARVDSRTTEAELSSLVAHCVRHTEKATPGLRKELKEESLPEGIKDVLRRLTGETFSEHTVLVTIERVRGIGGNAGSEARHNAQMMVVSKLLNDLATRRHRAMPSSAA